VAVLFEKQPGQTLVHADILDAVPTQHLEQRIGVLLVIEDLAAGVRPRRIELQPIYLYRLALVGQRFRSREAPSGGSTVPSTRMREGAIARMKAASRGAVIRNPEIDVTEISLSEADLVLGIDFLGSRRV
jgi:hypothetical protein